MSFAGLILSSANSVMIWHRHWFRVASTELAQLADDSTAGHHTQAGTIEQHWNYKDVRVALLSPGRVACKMCPGVPGVVDASLRRARRQTALAGVMHWEQTQPSARRVISLGWTKRLQTIVNDDCKRKFAD